jgi:hypothetical protein
VGGALSVPNEHIPVPRFRSKRSAAASKRGSRGDPNDRHPERVPPDGRAEARTGRSRPLCRGSLRCTMSNSRRMRTYPERAANPLECALTKSLDLKSPGMSSYKKRPRGRRAFSQPIPNALAKRGVLQNSLYKPVRASTRAASTVRQPSELWGTRARAASTHLRLDE